MARLLPLLLMLLLSACVVRTAADVATFPVRATGWTVDRLTTSQAEADRNRGRRERKAEAKERKEEHRAAKREREQQHREAEQTAHMQ